MIKLFVAHTLPLLPWLSTLPSPPSPSHPSLLTLSTLLPLRLCSLTEGGSGEEGGGKEKATHERPTTENHSESQAIHGGTNLSHAQAIPYHPISS